MAVQIIQDFIPSGRRNRPGYKLTPKYITIHDTANTQAGADARAHAQYLKGSTAASLPASWHFTVDDKVIYQHLPLNENGWHAGDGATGTGNRESIGIEICENKDGDRAQAEANAAWLCAKLTREVASLKPFPACMKQHYDWNKKNCPRVLRNKPGGWANFLKVVEQQLKTMKIPSITRAIGIQIGGKTVDEIGYLIDNATYIRAAYLIALIGGQVTGHGDYIDIVLPAKPGQAELEELRKKLKTAESNIAALQTALAAERKKIEDAKQRLESAKRALD